jgi:hypothetical protein
MVLRMFCLAVVVVRVAVADFMFVEVLVQVREVQVGH